MCLGALLSFLFNVPILRLLRLPADAESDVVNEYSFLFLYLELAYSELYLCFCLKCLGSCTTCFPWQDGIGHLVSCLQKTLDSLAIVLCVSFSFSHLASLESSLELIFISSLVYLFGTSYLSPIV